MKQDMRKNGELVRFEMERLLNKLYKDSYYDPTERMRELALTNLSAMYDAFYNKASMMVRIAIMNEQLDGFEDVFKASNELAVHAVHVFHGLHGEYYNIEELLEEQSGQVLMTLNAFSELGATMLKIKPFEK